MNMGMNTGAISAHLAEAEPMKMFTTAVSRMKEMNRGTAGRPRASRPFAPLTANTSPSWVQLKKATNWAAKKHSTM